MYSAFSWASMWIDLVFAVTMALIGAAAGWWLYRRWLIESSAEGQRARQAVNRLRELATSVAQDVGQHSSRVQEIGIDLSAARASGDSSLDELVLGSVADIMRANERLQEQLATAEVQLQRQAEQLETKENEARTDSLTGLFNRRAFDDEIGRRMAEWQRRKTNLSLVMIDVDHFKKFNDAHGHQAGDEVLRGVARVLLGTLREMDLVCRYGGEEFSIVLPVTSVHEALRAAERARQVIAQSIFRFESSELRVGVSLGVAQAIAGDDPAAIVKRADAALYAAKSAGRNCTYFHDGQTSRPAGEDLFDSPLAHGREPAAVGRPSPTATPRATAAAHSPRRAAAPSDLPPASDANNLAAFCGDLRRSLTECEQSQRPLSLMLIDVDDFKSLADRLGASVGELVLETMSEYLTMTLQKGDVVSRCRNGQFLVMMPGTGLNNAITVAERVRGAIAACAMQVKGSPLQFTVSLGLAEARAGDDPNSLIKRADTSLFASKAAGRNCTHVHNGESCEPVRSIPAAC